ncbi:nucleotidyltransferase [Bacillus daqingensis]|uniref:Nucleotidyltransferase n=1 Tax=Bacillus daqingensis TaxID=872396 RepID=A0ABV9NYJ3_9BACI
MSIIKPIGQYVKVDQDGFIINETSASHIDMHYWKSIEEAVDACIFHVKDHLQSIYLRGSVPKGQAIKYISDLDMILVTKEPITNQVEAALDNSLSEIAERHDVLSGIELNSVTAETLTGSREFSMMAFMISTQSVCMYGEHIKPKLPPFRISRALANAHLLYVESHLASARQDIVDNEDDPEDMLDCCSWIMKIIVRAGMALKTVEAQRFSRDLYPAYLLFSQNFPALQEKMRLMLSYAISPSGDRDELLTILKDAEGWLLPEVKKWMDEHNPDRNTNLRIND